jgi:uncharacterized protein (TIGR03086 family)
MSLSPGTTALTGGVALLERAMAYTLGGLLLVTPDAMVAPTPCDGWDLRALLAHMNESLLTLHEAIAVGHLDLDIPDHGNPDLDRAAGPGDPDAHYGDPVLDPVSTLRSRACRMMAAWVAVDGPGEITIADRGLAPGIVAATGAVEVAVHGWDVARACGAARPLPAELAEQLIGLCRLVVDGDDRPARFGTPVAVPPYAGPSDQLLAFLGRTP